MGGNADWLSWLVVIAIPLGLVLAGFWAHGLRRRKTPKVPPGDPGNPA